MYVCAATSCRYSDGIRLAVSDSLPTKLPESSCVPWFPGTRPCCRNWQVGTVPITSSRHCGSGPSEKEYEVEEEREERGREGGGDRVRVVATWELGHEQAHGFYLM